MAKVAGAGGCSASCGRVFLSSVAVFALLTWPFLTAGGESRPRGPSAAPDIERLGAVVVDRTRSDRARLRVGRALAQLPDPGALAYLQRAILDSESRTPLRAALLGAMASSPLHDDVGKFASARLQDGAETVEVRMAAAHVLGRTGSAADRTDLLSYTDNPRPGLRQAARDALLASGDTNVDRLGLSIAIVSDHEQPPGTRATAIRALGAMKDAKALPVLVAALAEEVAPLTDPKTPEDLYRRGGEVMERIAPAAARALGEIGDDAAVAALLEHTTHPEPEMRVAVFEALARIRNSSAVPAARKAMAEDTEQRVRRWAAVLLKELRNRETLPDLRRALSEDSDPGVRLQVVHALEAMNDRESVERIRVALKKEELKEVRAAMERALITLSAVPAASDPASGR